MISLVEPSAFRVNDIGRIPCAQREGPRQLIAAGFDHVDRVRRDRPGYHILAVRCHIHVVDRTLHWDALNLGERCRVDHIHRARAFRDPHIHARAVLGDSDIIRAAAQRNPLGHLERLRVDHIQRVQRFIGDVDTPPIRSNRHSMRNLDILDGSYHLVRGGVDHMNVVPGRVGLQNPSPVRMQQRDCRENTEHHTNHLEPPIFRPFTQSAKVCHSGSPCDFQCLPPCMKVVAARLHRQRMQQQWTLERAYPGTTNCLHIAKFARDCSSFHVAAPGASGCSGGLP